MGETFLKTSCEKRDYYKAVDFAQCFVEHIAYVMSIEFSCMGFGFGGVKKFVGHNGRLPLGFFQTSLP
jgi:hypothetical protein